MTKTTTEYCPQDLDRALAGLHPEALFPGGWFLKLLLEMAARLKPEKSSQAVGDLLAALSRRVAPDNGSGVPFEFEYRGPDDLGITPSGRIRRAEAIREPAHELAGIDFFLLNPPFGEYTDGVGLEKMRAGGLVSGWVWSRERPKKRIAGRVSSVVLFIDRALKQLAAGGSLAAVVPDSFLGGRKDLYFRDYLLGRIDPEAGLVHDARVTINASISLPQHTFAPSGTTPKTSVLCLSKAPAPEVEDYRIYMAVVDHVGYLYRRKRIIPDPEGNELVQVVKEYHRFKKGESICPP